MITDSSCFATIFLRQWLLCNQAQTGASIFLMVYACYSINQVWISCKPFSEKALVASQFDHWSSGLLVLLHLIFGLLWVIEHHARRLQHLECWPVFGVLHISKTSMLFGQPEETRTCSEADCFIYLHHLNSFEVVLCMSLECSIDQNTSVFWGAWET